MLTDAHYQRLLPLIRKIKRSPSFHGLYIDRLAQRQLSAVLGCSDASTLIIGPYIGEFGWEVAEFQGYARFLAKRFSKTIVISRSENAALYSDSDIEFIAHDPGSYATSYYSCSNVQNRFSDSNVVGSVYLDPELVGPHLHKFFLQDFRRFGQRKDSLVFDVLLHGREIFGDKAGSNWDRESWQQLSNFLSARGLRVGAIGLPGLSICPADVTDCRSHHLQRTMDYLASARLCVGPSSGAMHLAQHCATPVLVWTKNNFGIEFGGSANRYLYSWNPHSSSAEVLMTSDMQPEWRLVGERVLRCLDDTSQKPFFRMLNAK